MVSISRSQGIAKQKEEGGVSSKGRPREQDVSPCAKGNQIEDNVGGIDDSRTLFGSEDMGILCGINEIERLWTK